MSFSRIYVAVLASGLICVPTTLAAADQQQVVSVSNVVRIAGGELTPGSYNFAVEDRLPDRAIVRITSATDPSTHYLLLAVPSQKLSLGKEQLAYFDGTPQTLKAWKCASCAAPLEFVYPKDQAVAILKGSAQPVLAVDPAHDKLPDNLTPDDMKVVTLWLLSPEQLAPGGVKVAQYSRSATPDAGAARTVASASRRSHLPGTASNNFLLIGSGFACLLAALAIRRRRQAL